MNRLNSKKLDELVVMESWGIYFPACNHFAC